MSDDHGSLQVRQTPRKRNQDVRIADFTMTVLVPGQPSAVRVFTDDEQEDAGRYAEQMGGSVVALPLPPPRGYLTGAGGLPIPDHGFTSEVEPEP